MNGLAKQTSLWIILIIILVLFVIQFQSINGTKEIEPNSYHFDEALMALNGEDNIEKVTINRRGEGSEQYVFKGTFKSADGAGAYGNSTFVFETDNFPDLWRDRLRELGITADVGTESNAWLMVRINLLPMILIIGVFLIIGYLLLFMFRHMQGESK